MNSRNMQIQKLRNVITNDNLSTDEMNEKAIELIKALGKVRNSNASNAKSKETLIHKEDKENKEDGMDETQLISLAVKKNCPVIVKALLEAGASPDEADDLGNTLLMTAVSQGYIKVVKLLLEAKADLNQTNMADETALFLAASNNYPKIFNMLLEAKADPFQAIGIKETPFLKATSKGHIEIIKCCLNAITPQEREKFLISASEKGQALVVNVLLMQKINPNARVAGTTALTQAVNNGHPEVVELLVKAGATDPSLSAIDSKKKEELLISASKKGLAFVVNLLLKEKVNPNAEALDTTPLIQAANNHRCPDVVELLLKAGADPNKTTKNKITPLMFAAYFGDKKSAQHLVKAGADPKKQDLKGKTAHMFAKSSLNEKDILLILDEKADLNKKDEKDEKRPDNKQDVVISIFEVASVPAPTPASKADTDTKGRCNRCIVM